MSAAARQARALGALRAGMGLAFALAPASAGRLLVGAVARSAGARLFIAAFGARELLLGLGVVRAPLAGGHLPRWLAVCACADALDAAAVLTHARELPPGRRALSVAVSLVPVAAGARLAVALRARPEASGAQPAGGELR